MAELVIARLEEYEAAVQAKIKKELTLTEAANVAANDTSVPA
jgi:hypothetical protein